MNFLINKMSIIGDDDMFENSNKPGSTMIDLDNGLTYASKYRIMRWKLHKMIKDPNILMNPRYKWWLSNHEKIFHKLLTSDLFYDHTYNIKKGKMRGELDRSPMWEDMMEDVDEKFDQWYEEYMTWYIGILNN